MMQQYDPRLERLATVFLIRGFSVLAFAAIAVRWPEQSLAEAARYAGGIAVFLGIIELGISLAGDALLSVRAFRAGHAVLSIAFGIVSGMVLTLPPTQALAVAMSWLITYTAFVLLLAARIWYYAHMRDALLLWAAVNVTAIVGCANLANMPRTDVLLAGALYSAAMGVAMIVAARWMSSRAMAIGRRAH